MTAFQLPNGKQQFLDINGFPLVSGTVGMYVVNTLTPKNTWQDSGQNVLNTNPIVLDSRGQALIYGTGVYRQIVRDQLGNVIWDDPTTAPGGNSGDTSVTTVATIAALRAITATTAAGLASIYLLGYFAANDGGEGQFYWNATDATTDNNGTIINPTGNAGNGRWNRQFVGPLIDLWFGVIADGITDNSTALQNIENAANAGGLDIYYPAKALARSFATGLTTYPGVNHYGDGMNVGDSYGYSTGAGPSNLLYTGTVSAFSMLNGTGAVLATAAPTWRDMNITCTNGSSGTGITINSPTGGFTDDLTSQAAAVACNIDRVAFYIAGRGGCSAINWSKVFNSSISGCFCIGGDYGILRAYGSDNIDVFRNIAFGANVSEIKTTTEGTFMNMTWIRENVLTGLGSGASGHLDINSREIYIKNNWFENTQATAFNIKLTAGISAFVEDNAMFDNTTANWLVVNGAFQELGITNNSGASTRTNALFNAGSGHNVFYNSNTPATIIAFGNMNGDGGIPFSCQPGATQYTRDCPPVSGNAYWNFSPNFNAVDSTFPYYTSLAVAAGLGYAFPAASAQGSKVEFAPQGSNRSVTDTIDIWILASTSIANTTLSLIASGTTYTQALSTDLTWYKIASAVAVTALTVLAVYNGDTGNNGVCYVAQIQVLKH